MSEKTPKQPYRIRNWKNYNEALVERGSLTLWFDEAMITHWLETEKSGQRGSSRTYSDLAIQCALTLKVVFHLPLRATEGLLRSLLKLMDLTLAVPDYTTLCRRQSGLEVRVPQQEAGGSRHVVVDSTGLKVYGEGEWKVRQHGWSKRRTWRKLHLGVDESSGEIVAALLTTNGVGDGEVLPELLDQVAGSIEQVSGDGGYDTRTCYQAITQRGARATIPPRANAKLWQPNNTGKPTHARDRNLREIEQKGRKQWKQDSGYHRRSLAETAMFRIKTLFGDRLKAHLFESQVREAYIQCAALNRMTYLGMPDSYAVA